MSMRSRYLVLLSGLLVGSVGCDDDNNTNNDASALGDALGSLDGAGGDATVAETGTAADGGVVDGATADGATGETGNASDGGAGDGVAAATFTQVYTTVIATRCMPCHTTANGIGVMNGHLDMTSQATAFANLVNVPAAGVACAGKGTRVVPGMPDSSVLYLKISLDDPAPCGAKMPLGLPALPQAEADMIESWIMGGAKQ
jgi:hypothetical protein